MLSKLWFRFGIPLGSASILAALLELALSSYWGLHFFGSFFYLHVTDNEEPIDLRTIFGIIIILLRALLTLALWGFVLLGTRTILLVWLPLSVICDFLLIALAVHNITHDVSDEVWFLNLAIVVILRFYITLVFVQAFRRLLQNARVEAAEAVLKLSHRGTENTELDLEDHDLELKEIPQERNGTPTPTSNSDMILELDNPNRSKGQGVKGRGHDERIDTLKQGPGDMTKGPRYLLLEPIGNNPEKIWDFYSDTPRLGAAILVIFELLWNIFTLSTRSLTEFLLGGRMFFMINEEEIFMRIWRIVVTFVALIFIFKRRKTLLRFWLIIYFWTLFASLCIFVYVLADYLYPPPIQVAIICIMFFGDNCVRFGVVYFVLRTTIQPPAVTPTSDLSPASGGSHPHPGRGGGSSRKGSVFRSHSLRSQTGSRIKRNSLTKSTRKKYGTQKLRRLTDPEMEGQFG